MPLPSVMIPPRLPTLDDLQPWLEKLEANEGSIVLICLESFRTRCDCGCTVGWFSAGGRKYFDVLSKPASARHALGKARCPRGG